MIQAFRRFNMTVWRWRRAKTIFKTCSNWSFRKGNTVSRKAAQKISRWRNWVAIESNFPLQYYHWSEFLSFYLNFSIDWSVGPFAAHSNISQVYFIKNTIILIEVMFGEGNVPTLKDVDSQDSCVLKLRISNNFWPVSGKSYPTEIMSGFLVGCTWNFPRKISNDSCLF